MRAAVIPARGGSKRIPRKNIKLMNGKPVLARAIDLAVASKCFDRVFVSTEDDEIANVAEKNHATVLHRPAHLATDHASTMSVVKHSAQALANTFESICCIYPLTPLLRPQRLREGLNLLETDSFDFVISVTEFSHPPQRAVKLQDGRVLFEAPQFAEVRTQDLTELLHDSGQFYWGKIEAWLENDTIFGTRTGAVKLEKHEAVDIDDFSDWALAEALLGIQNNSL